MFSINLACYMLTRLQPLTIRNQFTNLKPTIVQPFQIYRQVFVSSPFSRQSSFRDKVCKNMTGLLAAGQKGAHSTNGIQPSQTACRMFSQVKQ